MADAYVPIYLPDETRVGYGHVSTFGDKKVITISVKADSAVAKLFEESVVGLSIVYLNNEARDIIDEGNKETNDEQGA